MKNIPNLLTAARIGLSVCLFFTAPLGIGFYALYLLCGLSDLLDGPIARKYQAVTEFGARLDSAADFVFISAVIIRLFPVLLPPAVIFRWIGLIFLIRLGSAIVAKLRFGRLGFLHTYGNKVTGLLLFLYPLSLLLTHSPIALYFLCAVATVSAVEELVIELSAKEWHADRKALFPIQARTPKKRRTK